MGAIFFYIFPMARRGCCDHLARNSGMFWTARPVLFACLLPALTLHLCYLPVSLGVQAQVKWQSRVIFSPVSNVAPYPPLQKCLPGHNGLLLLLLLRLVGVICGAELFAQLGGGRGCLGLGCGGAVMLISFNGSGFPKPELCCCGGRLSGNRSEAVRYRYRHGWMDG